jgi:hypothetical protein
MGTSLQVLGALLISFGLTCLIFPIVGGRLLDTVSLELAFPLLIACIIGIAFIPLGAVCYRKGKRGRVISAGKLMSKDKRPPVLYLRSFEVDDFFARATNEMKEIFSEHPLYRWSPFLRILATLKLQTSEEILAKTLNKVGPCIAVCEPGLEKPIVGFARFELSNDDWQPEVKDNMQKAGLVVLCAGNTPGLLWELEQAAENVKRDRLILLIAPDTNDIWWEKADNVFGQRLTRFGSHLDSSFCGIFYFDEQGNSHHKIFLTVDGGAIRNLLEDALSPVFAQLQIQPRPRLLQWLTTPRNITRLSIYLFIVVPLVLLFLFVVGLWIYSR